ncbi:MAG: 2Fe-2S iron-sulfur cluster-binding protein, partial [Dehalococcoidales bacterium]
MSNQKYSIVFQPSGLRGKVADGTTILNAARHLGASLESICGGKGVCGKCKVRIEEGNYAKYGIQSSVAVTSTRDEVNAKFLNKQQLKQNYRLACQTRIHGDVVVFVPEESRKGQQVVRKEATARKIKLNPAIRKYCVTLKPATLDDSTGDFERLTAELKERFKLDNLTIDYPILLKLQNTVRQGDWKVTVSVWKNKEIVAIEAGEVKKGYGLAVDIGTTTVAGYLCELTTGEVLATEAMMNPQVAYGEDVMSRIGYASKEKGGLKKLNDAIIKGLNQIIREITKKAGIKPADIVDMVVVGNTCIHHLFLKIDPQYLGKAPFPPAIHHSVDVKTRDMGL